MEKEGGARRPIPALFVGDRKTVVDERRHGIEITTLGDVETSSPRSLLPGALAELAPTAGPSIRRQPATGRAGVEKLE
jgi:hypothetical protein